MPTILNMSTNVASTPASVAPAGRKRLHRLLAGVALVALLAAAGVAALLHFGNGGKDAAFDAKKDSPFTIARPKGWDQVAPAKLATLKGHPLAVLRQSQGKGLVVVNTRGKSPGTLRGFSAQLDQQLSQRLPDFKRLSARAVDVRAGKALLYTYLRRSKGTVNTVVVVPGKTRTYVLNAVVPAGARATARQVGAMLASFDA